MLVLSRKAILPVTSPHIQAAPVTAQASGIEACEVKAILGYMRSGDFSEEFALLPDRTWVPLQTAYQRLACVLPSEPEVEENRSVGFQPNLLQLNPDMSQLNPDLSQLNPNLLQLNPKLSQLNPNLSQLNPDLSQLNPNLSQLNPKPVTT